MATFGLALENFTPAPKDPSFEQILSYSIAAEAAGFDSLWVWDHLFLGSRRAFPFLESLTVLTAVAARTKLIRLGTGVLVLPIRDPLLLAKVSATIHDLSGGRLCLGLAAGWYEREFEASAVPYKGRGRRFEQHLDLLLRLWTEDDITGTTPDGRVFSHVRLLPRPRTRPTVLVGGYVDAVLRRAATVGDGWLTYFYTAPSFARSWKKIRSFAEQCNRDPDSLTNVAQVPLCIGRTHESATSKAFEFVSAYFDCPPWSDSTPDSAVRGTPEQCAAQIQTFIDAGVQQLVLVPYNYELEQVHRLASEVLPLLPARQAADS
jgi:probable F420-dependent oxidoreductase